MRRFLTAKTLILFASLGSVTDVSAQTHAIAGRWSNDDTAEVIEITPDPIGGWRFHQSDIGDGNISSLTLMVQIYTSPADTDYLVITSQILLMAADE